MSEELYSKISDSIVEGEPDATVALTQQALAAGLEPMAIVDQGLSAGSQLARAEPCSAGGQAREG